MWVRTYDGPADWWDKAYALTLDPSGNVLATGYVTVVYDGDTNADYCTIKYAPDGTRQWVRWHDYGFGQAVASDSNGNVYVAGTKVTIKYYANGEVSWIRGYKGYLKGSDIAVDRYGTPHIVWSECKRETYYEKVMYVRRDGDTWTTPVNISRGVIFQQRQHFGNTYFIISFSAGRQHFGNTYALPPFAY